MKKNFIIFLKLKNHYSIYESMFLAIKIFILQVTVVLVTIIYKGL